MGAYDDALKSVSKIIAAVKQNGGVTNPLATNERYLIEGHAQDTDDVIDEEVRDAALAESAEIDVSEYPRHTFTIVNTLDQAVAINVYGLHVTAGTRTLLGTFSLADGSVTATQSTQTLTDPWSYVVITYQAGGIPTVGSLVATHTKRT